MSEFSKDVKQINADLNALRHGDKLEQDITEALTRLKSMDVTKLTGLVPKLLMGGGNPFEALGLNPQLFEQIEQLTAINKVARARLGSSLMAERDQLIEVIEGEAIED